VSAPPLVGLIGYKRSGKNAFADALKSAHEYIEIAFADPLKAIAYATNPRVGEVFLADAVDTLGWETAKDEIPEVRRFLQRLGTEGIRSIDDDFWLRQAREKMRARSGPMAVTDCRFPNEANEIRELGGVIVRIIRPALGPNRDAHVSEFALDGYPEDITVVNDSTLEELKALAVEVGFMVK
jgi:uncharacterized protein (DUF2342 family)